MTGAVIWRIMLWHRNNVVQKACGAMTSGLSLFVGLILAVFVAVFTETTADVSKMLYVLGLAPATAQAVAISIIFAVCIVLSQLLFMAMQRAYHGSVVDAEPLEDQDTLRS